MFTTEKKNIHKDHRQRVRDSYLKTGIDAMADHNILELLLFYCIPLKDTNPIAHELIEKYHDLNGVLDAPIKELEKVNGIGENAAVMIKLIAGQLDCGIAAACRREYGIKALHRDIGISLCAFGQCEGTDTADSMTGCF